MASRKEVLEIGGREVVISNPDKVYFPQAGHTKLDVVRYFLAVADGALAGVRGRPMALKRFVDGIDHEPFFQKRAPANHPAWMRTATLTFPSGRTADEIVVDEAAGLAWVVNLGCIDLNPHPVRADDLDHPDELRVDLDPVPGVPFSQVREVALVIREALDVGRPGRLAEDLRLAGHPRQRAHRAPLDLSGGPSRGACAGARRGAACPIHRDQQVVEGGAPRRLPRLQPERQGPHGRLCLLGPPDARRARLRAADLGRGPRRGARRLHASHGARPLRAHRRPGRRHRRCRRLARGAPGALRAAREGGARRRALAAQLRQAGR